MSVSEKFLAKLKVKVTKLYADDRNSLCGEPFKNEDGKMVAVIPAHQKDYIVAMFPTYEVSDEFMPDNKKADVALEEAKAEAKEKIRHICPHCKLEFASDMGLKSHIEKQHSKLNKA